MPGNDTEVGCCRWRIVYGRAQIVALGLAGAWLVWLVHAERGKEAKRACLIAVSPEPTLLGMLLLGQIRLEGAY